MARQIIILENQNPGRATSEQISYKYVFWLAVPSVRQSFYANPTFVSLVKDVTAPETTALQNGSIKETFGVFSVPSGTTLLQIEAGLVTAYNAAQAAITASTANPWDHYGTFWDGTVWTIVAVV